MLPGILLILGAGFGAVMLVSPKARIMVKGFGNLFIEDLAKTPKGAQAIYSQAIEEAQKAYGQAADTLNLLSGKMADLSVEHSKAVDILREIELRCETLARKNDLDSLKIYATQRTTTITKIQSLENQIEQLKPMLTEAKSIHNIWELKIAELKQEKELKINEMELANSMKVVYAKMDQLRKDSATDKLLEAVEDGVRKTKQEAAGSKMVYQNKIETKVYAIDKKIEESYQDNYIKDLIDKYSQSND